MNRPLLTKTSRTLGWIGTVVGALVAARVATVLIHSLFFSGIPFLTLLSEGLFLQRLIGPRAWGITLAIAVLIVIAKRGREIGRSGRDQDRRTRTRVAPVVGLLVLAPWAGEFLLGNIPLSQLAALPYLIPLYGGGALLIREVTRQLGKGWPTMLSLGAAYGVIEAGMVDQALFNPSFQGHEFHTATIIPGLGTSAHYAITFIAGHAIWSIALPVAIVEMLTPSARTAPWLNRAGLLATGAFYVFGCVLVYLAISAEEQFAAAPGQLLAAALVAIALIGLALLMTNRPEAREAGWIPSAPALGWLSFAALGAFFVRPESWFGVGMGIAVLAALSVALLHWSRHRAWSIRHEFAVVAGALPIYAMAGFILTATIRPDEVSAWIGNAVFASVAILLLIVTGRVVARETLR